MPNDKAPEEGGRPSQEPPTNAGEPQRGAGTPNPAPPSGREMVPRDVEIVSEEEIEARIEQRVLRQISIWSGPLPPPADLREYEAILPGCANRMLTMHEKDQAAAHAEGVHRRQQQTTYLAGQISSERLGMYFGLIVALAFLLVGAWVITFGREPWGGTIIGGTGLAGLVGTFIYGRSNINREVREKQRLLSGLGNEGDENDEG